MEAPAHPLRTLLVICVASWACVGLAQGLDGGTTLVYWPITLAFAGLAALLTALWLQGRSTIAGRTDRKGPMT